MSSSRARRSVAALVAVVALAVGVTACEASDDGTALLRNETSRTDLRVLVRDGAGRPLMDRALDPAFRFDTQFTDRERQCLVSGDGSFEVRDGDGAVLIQHDFADRPVCERDELEVSADLELVWSDWAPTATPPRSRAGVSGSPDPAQLAVTTREDHFGFQAGVVGRRQLRDGCFYVTRPIHGAEALVPVFPQSSVAEVGDHFIYQGRRYGSGDRIRLTGGLVEPVQDENVQVPTACGAPAAYWMVGPS